MKFIPIPFSVILFLFSLSYAQENWLLSSEFSLSATFNSNSQNWNSRDAGSVVWIGRLDNTIEKQLSSKIHSENTIRLGFGQTMVKSKDDQSWSSPQISTDLLDIQSILKYSVNGIIDPFTSFRATSQFYDERDENNIRFLNPLTLTQSFGMSRDIIKSPSLFWRMRLGGAFRTKFDRDTLEYISQGNQRIPGDSYQTSIITDGGTELVSEFRFRHDELLTLSAKLVLYEALMRSGELNNNYWRYPEISWENNVRLWLTENITFNYLMQVLYDREVHKKPRFRQIFSAGVTFSLSNR
ncbi:hypothetical protein QA601_07135 [Chitinispirillales bacterium ANBcel5]|uniref:hypothetical protein n=1 Tax=Cellulosispirillum alkaliphilum TaxID=3039283 RepID=UPI002A591698|nr:hypothetical protein [Chitinispirillales bacterium ANBcel5]